MRTFFRWLIREELLDLDHTRNIPAPRLPAVLPKVLTEQQAKELLKLLERNRSPLGRRNFVMISLCLDSGLRASELANLGLGTQNYQDVNLSFTNETLWDEMLLAYYQYQK